MMRVCHQFARRPSPRPARAGPLHLSFPHLASHAILVLAAALLTLAGLLPAAGPDTHAQDEECGKQRWLVEASAGYLELEWLDPQSDYLAANGIVVLSQYRTQREALENVCKRLTGVRYEELYGWKANLDGQTYVVSPFFLNSNTGQCQAAGPDVDGDGKLDVVHDPLLEPAAGPLYDRTGIADGCTDTPPGTPIDERGCSCEGPDCVTVCAQRFAHGTWDGQSSYPCDCICELQWGFNQDGVCVACDDLCRSQRTHYVYDRANTQPGDCPCKCEDGYELRVQECEKVACPDQATNIADLRAAAGAAAFECPSDRKLSRHCCCEEGTVPWGGVCLKPEEIPRPRPGEPYKGEPDKKSCKDYGVEPKDFDLVYDGGMLSVAFTEFLDRYPGALYRGSAKFPEGFRFDNFWYHLGTSYDAKFNTGYEASLSQQLVKRFQAGGKPLTPVEVFEESLKLNGNYVFDALLTCYNLLRQETEKRRNQEPLQAKLAEAEQELAKAQTEADRQSAEQKVAGIRASLKKYENSFYALEVIRKKKDNPGAWYHLFGAMSGSFQYPNFGPLAPKGEQAYRWWYKSDPDPLERCWDQWAAFLGARLQGLDLIKYRQRLAPGPGSDASAIKKGTNGLPLRQSGP